MKKFHERYGKKTKSKPIHNRCPLILIACSPAAGYAIASNWPGGCWRRWYLKHFRRGYIEHMAKTRRGSVEGAPHEILDPRDLKYCQNLCTCHWAEEDDPFAWRDRLPFARWGLAELQIMGWPLLGLTILLGYYFWYLAWIPAIPLCLVVWFFRDPPRRVPEGEGIYVSPADGKIAEITHLAYDDYIGGPAVRIGIFLSIFNVHLNRAPAATRVISLKYSRGEFLNALNPESALRNENIWVGLQELEPAVSPLGGKAHRRRHRAADSIGVANRRRFRARPEVRHDQARLAHRVDFARRRRPGDLRHGRPESQSRNDGLRAIRQSRGMTMRPLRTIPVLPTMFTLGNLVCGFFCDRGGGQRGPARPRKRRFKPV